MFKSMLLAMATVAATLTFPAAEADAFGGRGYARRQARRARYIAPAPVAVHRVYAAPVVSYRAPVYYHPSVSVNVGGYGSFYGSHYYGGPHHYGYPHHGGVSVRVGW